MSPKFFFSLFILSSLQSFAQKAKYIVIHCDVLGKKNETVRYYHPVEGLYHVVVSDYVPEKKVPEFLKTYYAFIDPRTHLTDSLNHIQANSLRHYIDPADLVYVEWKTGNNDYLQIKLDSLKPIMAETKNKKYQEVVEDYFKPFYFRKGEVTNREYREFVYWVRDSLFREAVYADESWFSDDEVFAMLNIPEDGGYYSETDEEWINYYSLDRKTLRSLFPFKQDFDIWEELPHEQIVPVVSQFYLSTNERWYKRRELDVTTLQYRYYYIDSEAMNEVPSEHDSLGNLVHFTPQELKDRKKFIVQKKVSVYPDTSSWHQDYPYAFAEPMCNMYFWHPAFDNYPVVGVSREQALAFLDWKQQQLRSTNEELGWEFEYALPTVYEYEWAINHQAEEWDKLTIQDNEMITNLLVSYKDGETGRFHEALLRGLQGFTEKVYDAHDERDPAELKYFTKRLAKMEKDYLENENNFSDERKQMTMRCLQNWLPGGICFLSNNVSEWMSEDYKTHYEKLFEAYVNYNCFANPDYCEDQRNIDIRNEMRNDSTGYLIMGGNWYDERYETILGVNAGGLYPKTFRDKDSSFATVGFRYVIRPQ